MKARVSFTHDSQSTVSITLDSQSKNLKSEQRKKKIFKTEFSINFELVVL